MNEAVTDGAERFLSDAAARGLDVDVVERPAARSLEEAAGILGISPADIVKSLVVKHRDGSFLFALIPGDRQISWPKLRALVGVNKLSLPHADVALAATGYERGTITPWAAPHRGPCTPTPPLPGVASPWAQVPTAGARSWTRMPSPPHSARLWRTSANPTR